MTLEKLAPLLQDKRSPVLYAAAAFLLFLICGAGFLAWRESERPVAQPQELTATPDHPLLIKLVAHSKHNAPLQFTLKREPQHGILTSNSPDLWIYTPGAPFTDQDSFAFSASDGRMESREATVLIQPLRADTRKPENDLVGLRPEDRGAPGTIAEVLSPTNEARVSIEAEPGEASKPKMERQAPVATLPVLEQAEAARAATDRGREEGLARGRPEELAQTKTTVNSPPAISWIGDQITEPNKTVELTFRVSGAESSTTNLTIGKRSSNPALLPERHIVIGRAGSAGALRITPASHKTGTSRVTLILSDGTLQTTNSFLFTVRATNTPPNISMSESWALPQDRLKASIPFRVADQETPAGALEVFARSLLPQRLADSALAISGAGAERALDIDPSPHEVGEIPIALVVSDGSLRSTNVFLLMIRPKEASSPILDRSGDRSDGLPLMTNSLGMRFVQAGGQWVGHYEVTLAEFEQLADTRNSLIGDKEKPAQVTWEDAITFCGQLTLWEEKMQPPLGDWMYSLLTTNEWQQLLAGAQGAVLRIRKPMTRRNGGTAVEWCFSSSDDFRSRAPVLGLVEQGERMVSNGIAQDKKEATHSFRCVLVPRTRPVQLQTSEARSRAGHISRRPKFDFLNDILRAKGQNEFPQER